MGWGSRKGWGVCLEAEMCISIVELQDPGSRGVGKGKEGTGKSPGWSQTTAERACGGRSPLLKAGRKRSLSRSGLSVAAASTHFCTQAAAGGSSCRSRLLPTPGGPVSLLLLAPPAAPRPVLSLATCLCEAPDSPGYIGNVSILPSYVTHVLAGYRTLG